MNSRYTYSLILMFLSPIMALVAGLSSRNSSYRRWLLIVFITFFGSVIILASSDGAVHLSRVYSNYLHLSFTDFWNELINIVKFKPTFSKGDVYLHVLSYIVGAIFGLPSLLFIVVSLIYGYFYVSGIYKVLGEFKPSSNRLTYFFYFFAFSFVMWKGLEGINTIRTWTGAWILFNGVFGYFKTREKRYLFLVLAAPLFHVAYFLMSLPVWIVIFLGIRPILYSAFFIASFFNSFNTDFVTRNISTTEIGENKIAGYYEEQGRNVYAVGESASGNFYVRWGKKGTSFWVINILSFLLIGLRLYWRSMTSMEKKIFSVGLVMITLANLNTFIPALFYRMMANAGLYILTVVLLMMMGNRLFSSGRLGNLITQIALLVSAVLLIPFLLFQVSNVMQFSSVFLFAFPFIPWIFETANLSVRELIGWIL